MIANFSFSVLFTRASRFETQKQNNDCCAYFTLQVTQYSTAMDGDAPEIQPMQFLDLNEDCIEEILSYLQLDGLVSVANTSKYMKKCADSVFSRYHRQHKFYLMEGIDKYFEEFGNLAKQLLVYNNEDDWIMDKIDLLLDVENRCKNNLEHLELRHFSGDVLAMSESDQTKIGQLFSNLKELAFVNCDLRRWNTSMERQDIKMENLEMLEFDNDFVPTHKPFVLIYPNLKTLVFTRAISSELLILNDHIRELTVVQVEDLSSHELQTMIRLQNLKKLNLQLNDKIIADANLGEIIKSTSQLQRLNLLAARGETVLTKIKHFCGTRRSTSKLLVLVDFSKGKNVVRSLMYSNSNAVLIGQIKIHRRRPRNINRPVPR